MMAHSKLKFKYKWTALGSALLCSAMGSSALTIDRAVGGIVLGKPLDLTVKVLLSPGEELPGLCAQVDVIYGDTMQEPGRVSVVTEPVAANNFLNLKVRSANPVDEPVVVLEVRAGCKQTISRRFVLLADLSAELQPAAAPASAKNSGVKVPAVVDAQVLPAASTSELPIGGAESTPSDKPVVKPLVSSLPPSIVRIKPKVVRPNFTSILSPAAEFRPRLRLAPIDLSQDWDPLLKVSSEMEPPPAEDLNKRREAAAFWRFLNLTPKDTLRVHAQEDELKALKLLMAKSQQQMEELNQQLQNAEEQRYSNPLVYTLIALLLALLGGGAYVYRRLGGKRIQDMQWWKTPGAKNDFKATDFSGISDPQSPDADAVLNFSSDAPATVLSPSKLALLRSTRTAAAVSVQADVKVATAPVEDLVQSESADELDFMLDADPEPQPVANVKTADSMDHDHGLSGTMRSINTHDMLDVRQQAEFFMTLGQCEDAIDMLQNSIAHSEDANPLVYLDLLKMLHTLSRKTEFDSVRQDFNRIFTGRVPPYIAFNEPTKGLESYPEVCEKIVVQWPHKSAIGFIEQCMVRGSVNVTSGRLDLEAFRDLLMLHALAKQFDSSEDEHVADFSAAKSDMGNSIDFADSQPMMLDMPLAQNKEVPELLLPPTFEAEAPASVDLDLSDSKDNLIDFDPSIFSLDLPESKP